MRYVAIAIGLLVWIGAIGASMFLNYAAGVDLDAGGDRGKAIGAINVAADLWKALCPVFLWALWRSGRRGTSVLLSLSWIAAFVYAMTNALGVVAERRGAWTEGRDAARATYENAVHELAAYKDRRAKLHARSPAQVQAAIDEVFVRPVKEDERIRGTVGSVSSKCERPNARTIEACAEVQALRSELVVAREAAIVDTHIAQLTTKVAQLRAHGGKLDADPTARMMSRLTLGWLAVDDAPLVRLVLLALFVELVSAFLPVGLVEYAHATGRDAPRQVGTRPGQPRAVRADNVAVLEHQPIGAVIDYVAERTEPAPETVALGVDELYADYETWCHTQRLAAASRMSFIDELDTIREHPDVGQKVRKFGSRYYGIRIAGQGIARLANPRKR